MRVLLLGGTTEASRLARSVAEARIDAVFSYAGRTNAPMAQPLPMRVGGFGGVEGLVAFLNADGITHVVDATHPFAAGMSHNAVAACAQASVALLRLERASWVPQAGDNWTLLPRLEDIPNALPDTPARVFLAIGKQQIGLFAAKPQHHYLVRLVDVPQGALPLADAEVLVARPPFTVEAETALMQRHRITHLVCKNGGGAGAEAKLIAARALGVPVLMAQRPALPMAQTVSSLAVAMNWLSHVADRGV